MKFTKTILGVLFASALFTVTALGADATVPTGKDLGQWSLSLGGSGAVTTGNSSTVNSGGFIELGHTGDLILPLEFGVRQGVGYATGNQWALSTHVFNDWTLVKLGSLEFDAGINGGLTYGNTPLAWSFAPEVVGRLWLTKSVNTFIRGEFPFDITSNGVRVENKVGLTLGLNVRF